MSNIFYFIVGPPRIGKTSVAKELSQQTGISWISTDSVRTIMRSASSFEHNPDLFAIDKRVLDTSELMLRHSLPELIDIQNRESREVWKGVEAATQTRKKYNDTYIFDGVALLPELVTSLQDTTYRYMCMLHDSEEQMRANILASLAENNWLVQDLTPEAQQQALTFFWAFNQWLSDEAKKYDVLTHTMTEDFSRDVAQIIEKILE